MKSPGNPSGFDFEALAGKFFPRSMFFFVEFDNINEYSPSKDVNPSREFPISEINQHSDDSIFKLRLLRAVTSGQTRLRKKLNLVSGMTARCLSLLIVYSSPTSVTCVELCVTSRNT